jgi:ribonuclease J
MDIVTQRDSMWGKSSLYKYGKYEPKTLQRDGDDFRIIPEFGKFLEEQGYVLIARASKRFDDLIAKMPGEPKKLYLSSWKGCLNPNSEAYNPALAASLNDGYEYMHTSGHCDMESLESLIEMLSPKAVIPIHTDSAEAFAKHLSNRRPVILLKDGESINPIGGQIHRWYIR